MTLLGAPVFFLIIQVVLSFWVGFLGVFCVGFPFCFIWLFFVYLVELDSGFLVIFLALLCQQYLFPSFSTSVEIKSMSSNEGET